MIYGLMATLLMMIMAIGMIVTGIIMIAMVFGL